MRKPILRYSLLVLALLAMTTAPAMATTIFAVATGDLLAGSTLTVNFQSGAVVVGNIGAGPGFQEGSALLPGFFHFTVAGDTFVNLWHLTNLRPDDFIVKADFLLTPGSVSLFDNHAAPSTPLSGNGTPGAFWVAGPPIIASAEYQPWADVQNLGDMFEGEWIQWAPNTFPFQATTLWEDDTDTFVPEPATLCLLGIGGALAYIRRRRKA